MRKNLLFVLAAVLLTAMIFSTATAGDPVPEELELGPCVCEVSVDDDIEPGDDLGPDGICDICGRPIPHGDGDGEGPIQNKDGSCQD